MAVCRGSDLQLVMKMGEVGLLEIQVVIITDRGYVGPKTFRW